MLVRARGLAKCYRGAAGHPVHVLRAVDLDAVPGELVAVVGASGSGKTTLLNLLGLLEPPDAGEIWFDDVRVSHLSRRAQARVRGTRIGYVFQSFLLVSEPHRDRQCPARRALCRARPRDGAARGDGPDGAPRRGGPAGSLSRPALRRRAAAGGLLPRGAERSAARARRRAHGQPRRRPRASHPGRAPRAGPRARHVGYPGDTPGRGGGGGRPHAAARGGTPRAAHDNSTTDRRRPR